MEETSLSRKLLKSSSQDDRIIWKKKKTQLLQKNHWLDNQGRVYFIYPIHQMALDMDKSETTIKAVMKELVEAELLEKIPEGRGRPNRLYILFPNEEVGQKTADEKSAGVGRKTVLDYGRKSTTSKYKSKKIVIL